MDDRESFVSCIRENREDDDLRQVFADWLEENGEYEEANSQREWKNALKVIHWFADDNDVDRHDMLEYMSRAFDNEHFIVEDGEETDYGGEELRDEWYVHKDILIEAFEVFSLRKFTREKWDIGGFTCSC